MVTILLKTSGSLLIVLALMHAGFPRYFKWTSELASLSLLHRKMMYVHMFFIALVVFMMGLMSLLFSNELINSEFGKYISLSLAVFWFLRLFCQFFVYPVELWKGKKFETIIHVTFAGFWSLLVITYFSAWIY